MALGEKGIIQISLYRIIFNYVNRVLYLERLKDKKVKGLIGILLFLNCENFFFFNFIYLFMAVLGLHFCARVYSSRGSGGHSSSRCAGLSLSRPLLLRSTGSRRAGSVIVAHGPSCSAACGIFLDQGSNPCPLHWQADSQPLRHQESPLEFIFMMGIIIFIIKALHL